MQLQAKVPFWGNMNILNWKTVLSALVGFTALYFLWSWGQASGGWLFGKAKSIGTTTMGSATEWWEGVG